MSVGIGDWAIDGRRPRRRCGRPAGRSSRRPRPGNGTVGPCLRSNGARVGPVDREAPEIAGAHRDRGLREEIAHPCRSEPAVPGDTPTAWPGIVPTGEKISGGLWTTACWGSAALLASRRRTALSLDFPRSAGRAPDRTATRTALDGSSSAPRGTTGQNGATYVHRLWTTMWTAGHEGVRDGGFLPRCVAGAPCPRHLRGTICAVPDTRGMTG